MRKLLSLGLILCVLLLASCQEDTFDSDSVPQLFFQLNNSNAGWNLGNTLDSTHWETGKGGETEWGNPAVNQTLMDGVKALGFGVIRIPVTWAGHIGDAPDYAISAARLNRVAEVVDMAHNAGLIAIINLHHEGSWLSIKKARGKPEDRAEITAKFARVWEQIAEKFKDYGDWLIFESMNEIQDGGWGWSDDFKTDFGARAQFNILNEWNQIFVDKVRASGANNADRYLVIPSYAASYECSYPGGTIKDHPVSNLGGMFKLPADSAEKKIVIDFHYYRPDNVGLHGTNSNWGNTSDKNEVNAAFKPFYSNYIEKGIPVIMGECGAVKQSSDEGIRVRKNYIAHVFATAKKYGIIPIYWDNGATTGGGEKFGIINRRTGGPNDEESREIIEAMMDAVK